MVRIGTVGDMVGEALHVYTVVGDRNLRKSLYTMMMGIGTVESPYIPW